MAPTAARDVASNMPKPSNSTPAFASAMARSLAFFAGLAVLVCGYIALAPQAFSPHPRHIHAAHHSQNQPQHTSTQVSGWNPFASPEPTGSTVLDAVQQKSASTLSAELARLGKQGANARDSSGNTAMHMIAKKGHYQVRRGLFHDRPALTLILILILPLTAP